MTNTSLLTSIQICFCFCLLVHLLPAQTVFPPLSPKGQLSQVVGNTRVEVEYERPVARGRTVFGELVPWDEVWRTGAGYCTKLRFDHAVIIGGQPVPAGRYALLTIPNPEEWIIILNRDTTLYGSYDYDQGQDVARFVVSPQKTERHYEALTIDLDLIPNNARMYISWINTQVAFEIQTQTDQQVMDYIRQELLSGNIQDPDEYGLAADYLLYQNQHYHDALQLMDRMIELGGNEGWARTIKMTIYERLWLYEEALREIEAGMEHSRQREYEKEAYRQEDLQIWSDHAIRIRKKLDR